MTTETSRGGFVQRLPAHVRLVAVLAFAAAVVATPATTLWPHLVHLAVVLTAAAISRVSLRRLGAGLLVETPFVLFALLLPFVALGPRIQVGLFHVSADGLTASASLLAKATLGVLAATVLASTTRRDALVRGLEKLRLPAPLVQILGFMVRYLDVVRGEVQRMRIALASRGFRARSMSAWPALAATVGTLFIRSYERGERVHLAMLSRGYAGSMPPSHPLRATWAQWVVGGIGPAFAVLATIVGRMSA